MTTATLPIEAVAYLSAVNAPTPGQAQVSWISDVAPAATHKRAGVVLTKIGTATVETGREYADLPENQDRVTGPLPWGEWNVYPWLIEHKGTFYARVYAVEGTVRVTYRVNGEAVSRETFAEYLTPSAAASLLSGTRPVGGTMSIKVVNLTVL